MIRFFKKKKNRRFLSLAQTLERKREALLKNFQEKHSDVLDWTKKNQTSLENLGAKSARGVAAGIAGGVVLLSTGAGEALPQNQAIKREVRAQDISTQLTLKSDTRTQVLETLKHSTREDLEQNLSEALKLGITSNLEGVRLNTNFGVIGHESHLSRFPGDNLVTHFATRGDYDKHASSAMAGGPGAWGYMAKSRDQLTSKDIERERYYLVVQTFESPNWGQPGIKEWFRHRKMVVVNPKNGNVVIGALEDAGPALSTKKAFGGSPEVMDALGYGRRGGDKVFMFFLDDPGDNVPLGRFGN